MSNAHLWPMEDGECEILAEISKGRPIQTPRGPKRLIFPRLDGWHQKNKAGKESIFLASSEFLALEGVATAFSSISTVTVGTTAVQSALIESTGSHLIVFTGTLTGDITLDLDIGAEAADTWYAIHVIADSTGVNATKILFSLSATAPTLPGTHDIFRLVWWIRNNGSSNFRKFNQADNGRDRVYIYDDERANLQPLNAGTATVFTAVSVAAFMPPGTTHILINVGFDTVNAGDLVDFRNTGSTTTSPVSHVQIGTATGGANHMTNHIEMLLPTQSFDYKITKGAGGSPDVDVFVQGVVINL